MGRRSARDLDSEEALGKKTSRRRPRVEQEVAPQVLNPVARKSPPLVPKTAKQGQYASLIETSVYTFGIGPAGTGKTYVAAAKACEHLTRGDRTSVVLTRPAVEAADEKLGFLPGELHEKFGPYMRPLLKLMIDRLGAGYIECAIKNERIRMVPMAFMRGETFNDTLVIADEMQNASKEQFKMLLTRIGSGSRMVIDGDPAQSDIGSSSGLLDAVQRLSPLPGVGVVRFGKEDIVRHSIIQKVIEAYEVQPVEADTVA